MSTLPAILIIIIIDTDIIHATCKSSGSSARNDLEFITERFFNTSSSGK